MKLTTRLTAVQRFLLKVNELSKRSTLTLYAFPALALFLITLVNYKFPVFTDTITLQYAAVIILTAWYSGFLPSILVTIISVILADQLFLPDSAFHHDVFFLMVFLPTALIISYLVMSQRRALETINTLALYDSLTGLPNRRLLHEKLELLLQMARRGNSKFGIIYIDVDNFKTINDQFGHHIGDEVLKYTAGNLQASARAEDIVSRYGGDEFVIVLNKLKDTAEAEQIAQRIRAAFNSGFRHQDVSAELTVSMGLAFYPQHGLSHEQLLTQADKALYKAKASGRNLYILA
jgi:diguanylate cyclase (GGDEF)-like protein